jgi:hypothetical protein
LLIQLLGIHTLRMYSVADFSEVQRRICVFRKDHGVRVVTVAQSWPIGQRTEKVMKEIIVHFKDQRVYQAIATGVST